MHVFAHREAPLRLRGPRRHRLDEPVFLLRRDDAQRRPRAAVPGRPRAAGPLALGRPPLRAHGGRLAGALRRASQRPVADVRVRSTASPTRRCRWQRWRLFLLSVEELFGYDRAAAVVGQSLPLRSPTLRPTPCQLSNRCRPCPRWVSTGLLIAVAIAVPTWLASIPLRDASLADRVWSAFIAVPVAFMWKTDGERACQVMLAIAVAWALRLGVCVTVRNWGHGEDRRYQAIRARNQPNFGAQEPVARVPAAGGAGMDRQLADAGRQRRGRAKRAGCPGACGTASVLRLAAGGLLVEAVADARSRASAAISANHGRGDGRQLAPALFAPPHLLRNT